MERKREGETGNGVGRRGLWLLAEQCLEERLTISAPWMEKVPLDDAIGDV
jgi:hypothetical protein